MWIILLFLNFNLLAKGTIKLDKVESLLCSVKYLDADEVSYQFTVFFDNKEEYYIDDPRFQVRNHKCKVDTMSSPLKLILNCDNLNYDANKATYIFYLKNGYGLTSVRDASLQFDIESSCIFKDSKTTLDYWPEYTSAWLYEHDGDG